MKISFEACLPEKRVLGPVMWLHVGSGVSGVLRGSRSGVLCHFLLFPREAQFRLLLSEKSLCKVSAVTY